MRLAKIFLIICFMATLLTHITACLVGEGCTPYRTPGEKSEPDSPVSDPPPEEGFKEFICYVNWEPFGGGKQTYIVRNVIRKTVQEAQDWASFKAGVELAGKAHRIDSKDEIKCDRVNPPNPFGQCMEDKAPTTGSSSSTTGTGGPGPDGLDGSGGANAADSFDDGNDSEF